MSERARKDQKENGQKNGSDKELARKRTGDQKKETSKQESERASEKEKTCTRRID